MILAALIGFFIIRIVLIGITIDFIWTGMLYKFPKDLNRFNHWMGSNLTSCIVYAGFVSTIMWLLIYSSDFYKDIHSATLIYSILVIGSLLLIYNWNRRQFLKYKEV